MLTINKFNCMPKIRPPQVGVSKNEGGEDVDALRRPAQNLLSNLLHSIWLSDLPFCNLILFYLCWFWKVNSSFNARLQKELSQLIHIEYEFENEEINGHKLHWWTVITLFCVTWSLPNCWVRIIVTSSKWLNFSRLTYFDARTPLVWYFPL